MQNSVSWRRKRKVTINSGKVKRLKYSGIYKTLFVRYIMYKGLCCMKMCIRDRTRHRCPRGVSSSQTRDAASFAQASEVVYHVSTYRHGKGLFWESHRDIY